MFQRNRLIGLVILLIVALIITACGQNPTPNPTEVAKIAQTAVAATLAAQPTTPPTNTPTPTEVPKNTPTPTETSTDTPTPTMAPTKTPSPTITATPTATATPAASVVKNANLRAGPGTNYQIVGKVAPGDKIEITGKDKSEEWFQIKTEKLDEAWIAGFLLNNVDATDLPVKTSSAPTVTPVPTSVPTSTSTTGEAQSFGSKFPQIGDEIEGGGWKFKVSEVHKRKVVYLYDYSYVAMGYFLIVVIDAVNMQSGTDYFANNIRPYVTDKAGNVYHYSGKASGYAGWQLGGLDSIFTDVNPGQSIRMAVAYDVPENVGDVLLSTAIGEWIYLGNFSQMPIEK